ncbi:MULTISPECIES: hypothetical protein [unclassified Nonomuraea]
MFKRRIAALVAVGAVLLAGGLAGSANAASGEPPAKPPAKGTCVTSDGRTFEFVDAIPATEIEHAEKGEVRLSADVDATGAVARAAKVAPDGETVTVTTPPDGAPHVQRWSEVTEAVPATPATEAERKDAPIQAAEITESAVAIAPADDENAKAVTIACRAE